MLKLQYSKLLSNYTILFILYISNRYMTATRILPTIRVTEVCAISKIVSDRNSDVALNCLPFTLATRFVFVTCKYACGSRERSAISFTHTNVHLLLYATLTTYTFTEPAPIQFENCLFRTP